MESHSSSHHLIAEVKMEISSSASGAAGNKICRGAACDFSDSSNTSKDAKERSTSMRKFLIAVILCVIFMTVEVVGGIKANNLAILTDAAHLLSDVAAFAISLFSLWAAGWETTPQQSYRFFRIEILGALVSIQLIWLLAGILVYEAIVRLIHESGEVQGSLMFVVSDFGLFVNIIKAVLLGHDHGHSYGHSLIRMTMAMAMAIQMMTIHTMKNKSRAMCITTSTAMEVLLLSPPITTTTQALDNIMMLRNHCLRMKLVVRVPNLLLRSLAAISMYTVLIFMSLGIPSRALES